MNIRTLRMSVGAIGRLENPEASKQIVDLIDEVGDWSDVVNDNANDDSRVSANVSGSLVTERMT